MKTVVAEVGSTAGTYHVLAKLAIGGMAEIFLARGASAAGLQRHVVLKRIMREKANDAEFVQMFLEEARLAAQLQHPNVAQVYDIGRLGDSYFFTMEYVHGATVHGLMYATVMQQRMVPLPVVLAVISGAAAGLHHAHDRCGVDGKPLGIVHRDVSPSNVMVSYEGGVKIVDFGIAKAESRAVETRTGTLKGKISYLSPEQCIGAPIDRRSDLFSLGIVLWEMLAGDRLYSRDTDFATMSAIVEEPPPRPSVFRPDLPPEIDALVLRLLAKDPAHRPQSGLEVVEAVDEVAARLGLLLSSHAVGRFVGDVLGPRREPWLELEDSDDSNTVISEAVPAPPNDPIDDLLDGLEDLSVNLPQAGSRSSLPIRQSMAYQAPEAPRVTAPTAVSRPTPDAADPDAYETVAMRTQADAPGDDELAAAPVFPTVSLRASSPSPAYTAATRSVTAPPAMSVATADAGNPPTQITTPRGGRGVALIAWSSGAALVGIAAALALRGGDNAPSKAPTVDAGAVVAQQPQAQPPQQQSQRPPQPPPADAANTPVVEVDATAPAPTTAETIEHAFAEKRYADVVAACTDVEREVARTCTLAACELRDTASAKAWWTRVASAQRPTVAAACKGAGVELTKRRQPTAPKQPNCLAEPLACRR